MLVVVLGEGLLINFALLLPRSSTHYLGFSLSVAVMYLTLQCLKGSQNYLSQTYLPIYRKPPALVNEAAGPQQDSHRWSIAPLFGPDYTFADSANSILGQDFPPPKPCAQSATNSIASAHKLPAANACCVVNSPECGGGFAIPGYYRAALPRVALRREDRHSPSPRVQAQLVTEAT